MPHIKKIKGYCSIYDGDKCIRYVGKSEDDANTLLELLENRPGLLLGRSNAQAIVKYKKEKQKLELAQLQPSQVDLRLGDFRDLIKNLADNSIDLVLTDPPYPKEYLPLWADLARESARVLKPAGFLIAYSGQAHLPKVLNMLSQYLDYYWLGMLYHKGPTGQRFEVNMWNRAKPILFYQKPPRIQQASWLEDVLESARADKLYHDWGQSIEPLKKLVECFSSPGQTVLDPFAGGGSTIIACIAGKRKVIAFENDRESYETIRKRLSL